MVNPNNATNKDKFNIGSKPPIKQPSGAGIILIDRRSDLEISGL